MEITRIAKKEFCVIGKEGDTSLGEGFIQKLWEDFDKEFHAVNDLAKKNLDGSLFGIWGLMSDLGKKYKPWGNGFTEGYYLAGVEVFNDAKAPEGFVKWKSPAYEYVKILVEGEDTFNKGLEYLKENGLELVGAVYDYKDPKTGKNYMWFPITNLSQAIWD